MTHTDYTKDLLNIKDKNINLYENYLETKKIKGIDTKIIHAYLTYDVHMCPICKHKDYIIKWNWKRNCKVKVPKVSNYNAIILLDKQRFKCKHFNHTFIATSNLIDKHCNISNNSKLSIKLDLMDKISEKDIAKRNNVSHNTVNRIIHSISNKKVIPGVLPTIINIDEFKATKDTKGKMAFHIINNRTGKTFDILNQKISDSFDGLIKQINVHLPKIEKIFSHSYYWCIDQCEFATDINFKNRDDLSLFYKTLVETTYFTFSSEDIYSFFGRNVSKIHTFSKGKIVSDLRNRYQGYRIKFKVNNNQIKMYDKGNNLRIEVTINNPKDFKVIKEKEKII